MRDFLSAHSGKPPWESAMRIEIRPSIDAGGGNAIDEEVSVPDKPYHRFEEIGLSLCEAKDLLGQVWGRTVAAQAAAFVEDNHSCPRRSGRLWSRRQRSFRFRTPFCDVPISGPRLKRCSCDDGDGKTFNPPVNLSREHVAPERLHLETKWASLVFFGATEGRLKDVLLVGATLNAETVRNHLH